MVGLGGIAGRRADAAIGLGDQVLRRESLVGRMAPELAAHPGVHRLGEGFRQPVAERLDEDRRIVVVGVFEAPRDRLVLDAGGDDEGADIVAARGRRDEIGERDIGPPVAPPQLLAQGVQRRDQAFRATSSP